MATDEVYDPKYNELVFKNKKITLLQASQTAKTTTTIAILIHRLLFTKQVTALAVANKRSTSEEIMRKFKEVLKELPFFLKPGIVNLSMKKIRFDNGSILNTAAASKTPATGDSLQLLYIDECALIPSNVIDDYWASVYNTMNSFYNA
jgi:phage terminase large subunit